MGRSVIFLYSSIVPRTNEFTLTSEESGTNWDTPFAEAAFGLLLGDLQDGSGQIAGKEFTCIGHTLSMLHVHD